MMYVKVTMRRQGGRRYRKGNDGDQIEGFLEISAGSSGLVAKIVKPLKTSKPPEAVLYDVRLLGLGHGGIRIRGFEEHSGAAVLQEWHCEVLDARNGFNAAGERLTEPLPWLAGPRVQREL